MKKKSLIALKKARTHLDNIISMIEKWEYCMDIIQQNLAVVWLIKSANLSLLECHLNTCVKTAAKSKNEDELNKKLDEILKLLKTAQNK